MRISDWSSDVCSSDLAVGAARARGQYDQRLRFRRHDRHRETRCDPARNRDAHRPPAAAQGPGGGAILVGLCAEQPRRAAGGAADGRADRRAEASTDERRVGNEWVSTCRFRLETTHNNQKTLYNNNTYIP